MNVFTAWEYTLPPPMWSLFYPESHFFTTEN